MFVTGNHVQNTSEVRISSKNKEQEQEEGSY